MDHVKTAESYEIHTNTMALLPFYNEFGNLYTEVLETERIIQVTASPMKIIHDSCLFFGSSYEGRREAVRKSMGYTSLSPIVINSQLGIFFFPVESPKNESCIWLAQGHVLRIDAAGSENCNVVLKNKANIPVPQSKYALETKLYRTAQYRYVLSSRIGEQMLHYSGY